MGKIQIAHRNNRRDPSSPPSSSRRRSASRGDLAREASRARCASPTAINLLAIVCWKRTKSPESIPGRLWPRPLRRPRRRPRGRGSAPGAGAVPAPPPWTSRSSPASILLRKSSRLQVRPLWTRMGDPAREKIAWKAAKSARPIRDGRSLAVRCRRQRAGRVRHHHRPERLRQEHAAPHHGWPISSRSVRGRDACAGTSTGPRKRHVPGIRALPVEEPCWKCGLGFGSPRLSQGQVEETVRAYLEMIGLTEFRNHYPAEALRRHEAARRPRASSRSIPRFC